MWSARGSAGAVSDRIAVFRHGGESWSVRIQGMFDGIGPVLLRHRCRFGEEGLQDAAEGKPAAERTVQLWFQDDGIAQRFEIASIGCEHWERDDHGPPMKTSVYSLQVLVIR